MLWLFGEITLASGFIIGGWLRAAWDHRRPWSMLNPPLVVAVSLAVHSLGMVFGSGVRAVDELRGFPTPTAFDWLLAMSLGLILFGKLGLVWTSSLGRNRAMGWLWPAFIGTSGLWSLFVVGRWGCE